MFDDSVLDSFDEEMMDSIINEFKTGWHMEKVQTEIKAQQASTFQEATTVEGLGQLRLSIDPNSFHYWGQREGYECWDDKGFLREYERDNPQARVRYVQRNAKIVVPESTISNKRESKVL